MLEKGDQSLWPIMVAYNSRAYESRLMSLIRKGKDSPELQKEIKRAYTTFKKERDEENMKNIEKRVQAFEDKELAKVAFYEYCVLANERKIKSKEEFLTRLKEDKFLLEKIENRMGEMINKDRLQNLLNDPAWKDTSIEQQPIQ